MHTRYVSESESVCIHIMRVIVYCMAAAGVAGFQCKHYYHQQNAKTASLALHTTHTPIHSRTFATKLKQIFVHSARTTSTTREVIQIKVRRKTNHSPLHKHIQITHTQSTASFAIASPAPSHSTTQQIVYFDYLRRSQCIRVLRQSCPFVLLLCCSNQILSNHENTNYHESHTVAMPFGKNIQPKIPRILCDNSSQHFSHML